MTSKRELIFSALYAVLQPALAGLTRNEPLIDFDGMSFATLDDGTLDNTEEFLNPPLYEFTMTPALTLVVKGEDGSARDAALAALIDAAQAALDGITDDLGGLITAIRPQPVDYGPKQIWAGLGIKGAEMPIELDFWSTSSLG